MAQAPVPSASGEYPPILDQGFHKMTEDELEVICVTNFPNTGTRKTIWEGLRNVLDKLKEESVPGELWVDGSFLTQKRDPKDVDIVLSVDGEWFDSCSPAQDSVIRWIVTNLSSTHRCDSYVFPEYSLGHPLRDEYWRGYWADLFSHDRDNQPKGIAVIPLTVENNGG